MNKLEELYNTSSTIIDGYNGVIYSSTYTTSKLMYNMSINWIKGLLKNEYELIDSMSLEEVEECLKEISLIKEQNNSMKLYRVKKKLLNRQEVLQKGGINSSELQITNIPNDIQFGINDLIESMIDIEVAKRVKEKIYNLEASENKSKNFIYALKANLLGLEVNLLNFNSTSEIIALYHDIKIDKMPSIDIKVIEGKESSTFRSFFKEKIMVDAKRVIDRLANTTEFYKEDNPMHVFDYLVNITKLEILLSYMDDELRASFSNYCSGLINDKNSKSVKYVKELIIRKVE